MPLPTYNDVQAIEQVLTNLLVGYMQADDRFIASKVFPFLPPVQFDSGTYYVITKKYFFRDVLKKRAPGGPFPEFGFGVSTGTYSCVEFAGSERIPDENRRNSQMPMDLETLAVRQLAQASLIRKEVAFSSDFMTSGWGTTDSSTTDWDDFSAGDPVNDIWTAKRTISMNTGVDANSLVIGHIVHQALCNHPDVIDRVKYTAQANANNIESALAGLFGLANYWVGRASYTNTNESASFSVSTTIIDDDALVCYVDPNPGIFSATAGLSFAWDAGGGQGSLYRVRDDNSHSDVIQHLEAWDQVLVASDLGYNFTDVV
jgi:hypothetical protein